MEDFHDYDDQDLIDELVIDAWAAVMHQGELRATAWKRFEAATQQLHLRYPPTDTLTAIEAQMQSSQLEDT